MARTSRSRSPPTRNTTLAIRIREPLAPKDIIAPVAGDSVPTRANRRPYPGCSSDLPHRHSTAESSVAPLVEEHQKTSEAIRKHWTENQKCRIAENEAVLRQLADIEPKVANLSIGTHFPRGNDLTVQEQIAIIHGGATPAQYEAPHKTLLERQHPAPGGGPITRPIENVTCVNVPDAVSVYMDFSANYGNGVGELIPLEDDTTCHSILPSYNGAQYRAPSGTGCYGIDKNGYWVFTGGDLEGSCLTPSGPSPGPLPGGSGGGDKLKRNMRKGIRFGRSILL